MKVYYIRLNKSDFTISGKQWVSPVIDLYENDSYTNYSVTKGPGGLDLLGDGTWVGKELISEVSGQVFTDTGRVVGGKYIDESGSITIGTYYFNLESNSSTEVRIGCSLEIFNSSNENLIFPQEWTKYTFTGLSSDPIIENAQRYVKLVATFTYDDGLEFNGDFWLRINIDPPVMTPFYSQTENLLQKFPSWMKIRDIGQDEDRPTIRYPDSLGGKLLNAISGEWLNDLKANLDYMHLQRFIDTVDISQVAWIYEASRVPDLFEKVYGDDIQLVCCGDLKDFFDGVQRGKDVYYWTEESEHVYVGKNYDELRVDDTVIVTDPYHVWNYVDELGLLVDLTRLHLENNESFRLRIKDVYINKPGVNKKAIQTALRRELNMWAVYGSTPDSAYLGATPEILEVKDILEDPEYMSSRGFPTEKFVSLIQTLADQYPTTWGHFRWDEARYDIGGMKHEGYGLLPHVMDVDHPPEPQTQNGIGDYLDLLIYPPQERQGVHDFTYTFKARGKQRSQRIIYPRAYGEVYVYGAVDKLVYNNPEVTVWLTAEITTAGANPQTFYHSFQLSSTSDVDVDHPVATADSFSVYPIFNEDGWTDPEAEWRNKLTNRLYRGPGATPETQINKLGVARVVLKPGRYVLTPTYDQYDDKPLSDVFQAWFAGEDANKLQWNTSTNYPTVRQYNTFEDNFDQYPANSPEVKEQGKRAYGYLNFGDDWYFPLWADDATPHRGSGGRFAITQPGGPQDPGMARVHWPWGTDPEDGPGPAMAIYDVGSPEQNISLTFGSAVDSGGLVFRFVDANNHWALINAFRGFKEHNDAWLLFKVRNGNVVLVDKYVRGDEPLSTRTGRSLTVECYDDRITVRFNGTIMGSYSDTTHSQRGMGAGIYDLGLNPNNLYASFEVRGANFSDVVMSSKVYTQSTEKWYSEKQLNEVVLNGKLPNLGLENHTIDIPDVGWPEDKYLANPPVKQYIVELITLDSNGVGGLQTYDRDNNFLFLPGGSYLECNGSANWVENKIVFPEATARFVFRTRNAALYPYNGYLWSPVEYTGTETFSGSVDEFGPWKNDEPSRNDGNANFLLKYFELDRDFFNIPNTNDFMVNWIEPKVLTNADDVSMWMDVNLVNPHADDGLEYPDTAIDELYDSATSKFIFETFSVKAKLRPEPKNTWSPYIYSGWLYDEGKEFYLYASPSDILAATPTVSIPNTTPILLDGNQATPSAVLPSLAGLGAPIIVKTHGVVPEKELRQVAFFDWAATPDVLENTVLGIVNKEQIKGTGTNKLYLAYDDVYNVTVKNLTTNSNVTIAATPSNEVILSNTTNTSHTYEVKYILNRSFYADHDYIDSDGKLKTRLVFDKAPSSHGASGYKITYETSLFNPLREIDVPLNPTYTTIDKGFVFIGHDEYDLSKVFVNIAPSILVADSLDYATVSITAVDKWGNPKSGQVFSISSTWGSLDATTLRTNDDGYAYTKLRAAPATSSTTGTINVAGTISVSVNFKIQPRLAKTWNLKAVAKNSSIPADGGNSQNVIYGLLEDENGIGIGNVPIVWRKARSIYKLFGDTDGTESGVVYTASDGTFTVDGFGSADPSNPGYWFVSLQTTEGAPDGELSGRYGSRTFGTGTFGNYGYADVAEINPLCGDVVYWFEYPDIQFGTESGSELPVAIVQSSVASNEVVPYSSQLRWLSNYSESTPYSDGTISINWQPPQWFAMKYYDQYQLGLLGNTRNQLDLSRWLTLHPPTREF